jgi:hypothetical protein
MKCRLVFHFISFPGFVFPSYKMFLSSNYGWMCLWIHDK